MSSSMLFIPSCDFLNLSNYIIFTASFFVIFFNTFEILTVFIHSSPKFVEHLYDHYFELFLRWIISTLFSSFLRSFASLLEQLFLCLLALPSFLFLSLFFNFNWRLITLQYLVVFAIH